MNHARLRELRLAVPRRARMAGEACMNFGQMIVDHAAPMLQRAGYRYDGPLVAERWNRTPDGGVVQDVPFPGNTGKR